MVIRSSVPQQRCKSWTESCGEGYAQMIMVYASGNEWASRDLHFLPVSQPDCGCKGSAAAKAPCALKIGTVAAGDTQLH